MSVFILTPSTIDLQHHGIKGQKWGVRRFQNADGTLTSEGKQRYGNKSSTSITEPKYKTKKELVSLSDSVLKDRKKQLTDSIDAIYKKEGQSIEDAYYNKRTSHLTEQAMNSFKQYPKLFESAQKQWRDWAYQDANRDLEKQNSLYRDLLKEKSLINSEISTRDSVKSFMQNYEGISFNEADSYVRSGYNSSKLSTETKKLMKRIDDDLRKWEEENYRKWE